MAKRSKRRQKRQEKALSPPNGGWTTVLEAHPGAWQQNYTVDVQSVLTYGAVYACIRLISSDIAKLKLHLLRKNQHGIWQPSDNPAYSPVLRKPNHFQTRIKFFSQWIYSKLIQGNTYVLKIRDSRGVVYRMYVLDPNRVHPLVSDSGEVFYRLNADNLNQVQGEMIVPAREIIHDVHTSLTHPLCGVSPISASGLSAMQGLKIQGNSTTLFSNMSRPSGVLTGPDRISDEVAASIKQRWQENYSGENMGRVAVMGAGLEYKPIAMTAEDAQLIEQLKWTAEDVCRAFGVPPYKIGIGQMPNRDGTEALAKDYYSETLQELIECIEILLNEGLDLSSGYQTEFDLEGLLRMDSKTRAEVAEIKVRSGTWSPNESRARDNLDPVEGGESPYLQQQNFSLAALAKRDSREDPFTPPSEPDESEEALSILNSVPPEILHVRHKKVH